MKDNELIYPMSLMYVLKWSIWEALRELWSNAHDADPTGSTMKVVNNILQIQDHGKGIKLEHLLLGEHQGEEGSIGVFGEGLKIAMLVLVRSGHNVTIYSNNLILHADIAELFGKEVLRVAWEETTTPRIGTLIEVDSWTHGTFHDRFIFNNDDSRILCTTANGSLLDGKPALFHKGVFVSDLSEKYAFGYLVDSLEMNRDRNTVDEDAVHTAIGQVWERCTNRVAWRMLFESIYKGKGERDMKLSSVNQDVREAMKAGFYEAFGDEAVLKTSDHWEREAQHYGAYSVDNLLFGCYLYWILQRTVKTDEEYAREHGSGAHVEVTRLTRLQRMNFNIVRKVAQRAKYHGNLRVVHMDLPAAWNTENGDIDINVDILEDLEEALVSVIHEIGHSIRGAYDTTDQHAHDIALVGARLAMA